MFINPNFFETKNFILNDNSKELEVSFSRIYPIKLPYFIKNKIRDSSIFYVSNVILIYAESFLLKEDLMNAANIPVSTCKKTFAGISRPLAEE